MRPCHKAMPGSAQSMPLLPESRFTAGHFAIAVTGEHFYGVTYLLATTQCQADAPFFVTPEHCDSQFLLQSWYALLTSRARCAGQSKVPFVVLCRPAQLLNGDLTALAQHFWQHRFYFAVPLQERSLTGLDSDGLLQHLWPGNCQVGFYDEHSVACLYRLVHKRPAAGLPAMNWPPALYLQPLCAEPCFAAQATFLLSLNQIHPSLPAKDYA